MAPTYQLVAAVGQPGGPNWEEFDRCRRVCQLESKPTTLAASRPAATNDNNSAPDAEGPPKSDAPPPTADDTPRSEADLEDIPF
jgi:hypothetical protein